MPSTYEFAEQLEKKVEGGISRDSSRWSRLYTIGVLNQGRAVIASQQYKLYKTWNPVFIQTFFPEYEYYFQSDTCVTRFHLPSSFVQGDQTSMGVVYAGGDPTEANLCMQNFRRIRTRTEVNDFLKHPILSPSTGRYIGYLLEGMIMTIFSRVKTPCIGGVFSSPTSLPDFNVLKDEYPCDLESFEMVSTYVYKTTFGVEAAQTPNTLPNNITDKGTPMQKIR